MSGNTIRALACIALLCFAGDEVTAQQQRKFIEGLPFIYWARPKNSRTYSAHPVYRSFDGTNNNIDRNKSEWGASDIALFREIAPVFGSKDPKNAIGGTTRPSARLISNAVSDEPVTTFNTRGLSTFVYVWGQFIDHDMTLTPTDTVESVPIPLPVDEKVFTTAIPFSRSQVFPGTGTTSVRDEINLNTAWLDGSMIYGSDSARANYLRSHVNGKLRTSAGNYLPYNTLNGELSGALDPTAPSMANDNDHTVRTFVTGDVRASEHPGILSLHTLFLREHNRICDRLIKEGVKTDEEIYQRARKEIGAIVQAITYQEFLPAIGITLAPYTGYKPNVRPDIANSFATAAYRIGHTMVADDILLRDNNCAEVSPGELDLVTAFWNPSLVTQYKIDPFLKGFAAHTQYETDTRINTVLRNFLFGSPNSPVRFGIDLASLNIQRGRDHGLADYNTFRKYYTGTAVKDFSNITSDKGLADTLRSLYGNVNNMDLWVGGLAEDKLPGKSIGLTMFNMLKTQFEHLRDGDYYFYLSDPYLPTVSKARIILTKLSDVIKNNTSLTNIQKNVFFTTECADDSALAVVDTAGKKKDDFKAQPKLVPNPANTTVTVDLGGSVDISSLIMIYSVNGLLFKTINVPPHQQTTTIDISKLQTGVYMVNIITGGNIKTLKLLKVS